VANRVNDLERYERIYRALAAELNTVRFISPGSVVSRYTTCGKPGCRCVADPPQRHGLYYQWSHAVAGKSVSRRVTKAEADLHQNRITNRRRVEGLIAKMEQTSADKGRTAPTSISPNEPR